MTNSGEFLTYVNGRVMPYPQALPELQRINMRSAGGYYDSAVPSQAGRSSCAGTLSGCSAG